MKNENAIGIAELRGNFADLLNRVRYTGERLAVKNREKLVAAIIPYEDLLLLEKLEDKLDARLADEILESLSDDDLESWEKVQSKHGK